jgi:transposase
MQQQCTQVDFVGQHVYVGIDMARRSWRIQILVGELYHKRFTQPPKPEVLVEYLRRNFPRAEYHCVYEAGYFGFWVERRFQELGIDCMVINAADVPTSNKERRHKNDSVDAGKLARFVRKQTRCKNQIKAFLAFYGYTPLEEAGEPERHWSRAYVRWIESTVMEQPSGRQALTALLKELLFLRGTIAELTKQIRRLAHEPRYRERIQRLCTIPGISITSAMTLLTELVTIERFKTLDQLASYTGLIPGEYSSGETDIDTGITPRRNPAMRHMLIECAWIAKREDPALLAAFNDLRKRMEGREAIVRIARKLLNRVRYVLRHNEPYVPGIVRSA